MTVNTGPNVEWREGREVIGSLPVSQERGGFQLNPTDVGSGTCVVKASEVRVSWCFPFPKTLDVCVCGCVCVHVRARAPPQRSLPLSASAHPELWEDKMVNTARACWLGGPVRGPPSISVAKQPSG